MRLASAAPGRPWSARVLSWVGRILTRANSTANVPNSSKGATHWPRNRLAWSLRALFIKSAAPIAPTAAHRNVSDGSFEVCSSMFFATSPSRGALRASSESMGFWPWVPNGPVF